MTAAAIPDERSVRNPAGACIADERQELDNARFAQTVSAVAALLADAGLRRDGVLAIMLPNRVELITSMFAAWRLGAAVTPVNPALTGQEARYQIDDASATIVVADSATAALIVTWFQMTGGTRSMLVLPLFHVNGIMVSVVSPLLAGGSTFIAERFDAATFWTTVERAGPTFFSAVPTIYALLVSQPGGQADTKNLRYVICGAAPMPRELISEFEQRFGVPVVEGYGLSECTVVCTANPVHGVRKAGSVGLALPGVDVGVVDSADQFLPAGQAGEVVIRGPNVMRGYLGRPEESAEVLRGGWLHTGDVGRFDDDGYLTLVDRVKDLIIRGGENIYPKEIEDVLYTVPAVLEAAVVGQPDPVFGEQPVAFVTLRSGFDVVPEDLIEHCRQSLARYKVPRKVYIEETLPKNAVGKIAKPELRRRLRDASAPAPGSETSATSRRPNEKPTRPRKTPPS